MKLFKPAIAVAQPLCLCLSLFGCAPEAAAPPKPLDTRAREAEISRVLDDFHDAAAKADEERYFRHLGERSVFLGTDAKERWDKTAFRSFAHPYFAKGKAWSFRATRRATVVSEAGQIAWFDEDLETQNLGPARGSGVLLWEASQGTWQIAQYNLSITVPNERFGEVKRLLAGETQASPASP